MSGQNLEHRTVSLPPSNGKVTLVALAYSEKSEEYLKAWRQPLFDLFIKAPGTSLFQFDPYDANVKFVVLLTGAKKIATRKIRTKLEDNAQDHWKEHIMVVKGKSLSHYSMLDLGRTKNERVKPYFFLLNKDGKIVYATSGAYTADKQQEIQDKLEEMLGSNQFDD